ncbi:hypothetical protein M422DRAFT_261024 [Sphaerobolus stellatus SS14]|uniref:Uncharacterized protein n=1 Tax=Sphaerobolus stellatus (strain SS14) TaxID=990650 RepID=A0A0C9UPF4_SPHS4|nr:hypothetical protein M422DRAFT_261024 [Sphaerobolus stellatus SS14]
MSSIPANPPFTHKKGHVPPNPEPKAFNAVLLFSGEIPTCFRNSSHGINISAETSGSSLAKANEKQTDLSQKLSFTSPTTATPEIKAAVIVVASGSVKPSTEQQTSTSSLGESSIKSDSSDGNLKAGQQAPSRKLFTFTVPSATPIPQPKTAESVSYSVTQANRQDSSPSPTTKVDDLTDGHSKADNQPVASTKPSSLDGVFRALPKLYHADGNITLLAEQLAFCVRREILISHCQGFVDILSAEGNSTEVLDGCSVIRLSDKKKSLKYSWR